MTIYDGEHQGLRVQRLMYGGHACVRKVLRDQAEADILECLARDGFPVPRVMDLRQEDDGLVMYMEDLGVDTLEVQPQHYIEAIALLHTVRRQILPYAAGQGVLSTDRLRGIVAERLVIADLCTQFGWGASEEALLADTWSRVQAEGVYGEPLVASHGDYHPQNLIVRDGRVHVIDWEKAGLHSIYQDVYALLDMCYPDPRACLTRPARDALLATAWEELGAEASAAGYDTFVRLNRLFELVQIAGDLERGARNRERLLLQGAFVRADLARRAPS